VEAENSHTELNLQRMGKKSIQIKIETEVLPADYVLYQNYPNPFNPSTKINSPVPLSTKVTVQIYNQLGELVAQPINSSYEAGNYEVDVNMSAFCKRSIFLQNLCWSIFRRKENDAYEIVDHFIQQLSLKRRS